MLKFAVAFVLAMLLTLPVATAEYLPLTDGCNDDDADTGCCPVSGLIPIISLNPTDWAACFNIEVIFSLAGG